MPNICDLYIAAICDGPLSVGLKRTGRDADSFSPYAEVKNEWSYTSTPPIYSMMFATFSVHPCVALQAVLFLRLFFCIALICMLCVRLACLEGKYARKWRCSVSVLCVILCSWNMTVQPAFCWKEVRVTVGQFERHIIVVVKQTSQHLVTSLQAVQRGSNHATSVLHLTHHKDTSFQGHRLSNK
jgi:hypothetical protein